MQFVTDDSSFQLNLAKSGYVGQAINHALDNLLMFAKFTVNNLVPVIPQFTFKSQKKQILQDIKNFSETLLVPKKERSTIH